MTSPCPCRGCTTAYNAGYKAGYEDKAEESYYRGYRQGYNDHAASRAHAEAIYGPYTPPGVHPDTWFQHGRGENP